MYDKIMIARSNHFDEGDCMSKPITQCQAVINSVSTMLGNDFVEGETNVKEVLTSEQLNTVADEVTSGILNVTVNYSKPTSDEKVLRNYVVSMISNHFRKSKKLNGGNSYQPNSSGRGSRDTILSNLQKLIKNYNEGTPEHFKVAEAILERKSVLETERSFKAAERKKKKMIDQINFDELPPELQEIAADLKSE